MAGVADSTPSGSGSVVIGDIALLASRQTSDQLRNDVAKVQICMNYGFIHDEAKGDPNEGTRPQRRVPQSSARC
jgi:hypothetical protein